MGTTYISHRKIYGPFLQARRLLGVGPEGASLTFLPQEIKSLLISAWYGNAASKREECAARRIITASCPTPNRHPLAFRPAVFQKHEAHASAVKLQLHAFAAAAKLGNRRLDRSILGSRISLVMTYFLYLLRKTKEKSQFYAELWRISIFLRCTRVNLAIMKPTYTYQIFVMGM